MEPTAQKSLERVISHRAMQMSNSFPCKIWVLGFFCGVCITYLLLVALTPYQNLESRLVYRSPSPVVAEDSSLNNSYLERSRNCNSLPKDITRSEKLQVSEELSTKEKVLLLYSAWDAVLNKSKGLEGKFFSQLKKTNVPNAPHLENCKLNSEINKRFDERGQNGNIPPWTLWKGLLGLEVLQTAFSSGEDQIHYGYNGKTEGAYPPWIIGSDEDNFPLTRQVQKDIWIHQHPQNCNDLNIRFLVSDWERLPGFGMGAQLYGMSGLLAVAVNENRILVTDYYNRADHDGCQGSSRSQWSCYFFPETSLECRNRAFNLMRSGDAWVNGTVTVKNNYTSKQIWAGRVPRVWGEPWNYLQPTTEIDESLLKHHKKMDRRWWRAQAIRYLMRFQSDYTCGLLNVARHSAFGFQAAEMVLRSLPATWPKVAFLLFPLSGNSNKKAYFKTGIMYYQLESQFLRTGPGCKAVVNQSQTEIDQYVWSSHKPWIPRPLLSMHVRMGDKACEMKVVGFENYMNLANRIREHFPNLNTIWLSTEMQEVIDKSRSYYHWSFYYTKVTRQAGNMTMAKYEASLGRETSTNYPLVNFIMASEADFFVGALGSTWCYLIDGMRNTGGKVMAGYLSVNKHRFW